MNFYLNQNAREISLDENKRYGRHELLPFSEKFGFTMGVLGNKWQRDDRIVSYKCHFMPTRFFTKR